MGQATPLFSSQPYSTPIPNVARYGQAGLLAKTAYQNTLARINRSRSQTLRQYGYLGDVNPQTGVMQNVRVDPHNPYGNLQTMFRNHALQDQEAQFAAQERGLRGGLANKAYTQLKYAHGAESAQLGTGLTDQVADFQDAQTQAKYEFDRALYEAQLEAARNAISNGDYNPANTGGGGDGGGDGGGGDDGRDPGYVPISPTTFKDPYTAAAALAQAAGYGGYIHPAGAAPTRAKPKPKYTYGGWSYA